MVVGEAEFFSSYSFIEFQTVKFKYVSSWNFARVFQVLAWVIRVGLALRVKTCRVFEFWVSSSI